LRSLGGVVAVRRARFKAPVRVFDSTFAPNRHVVESLMSGRIATPTSGDTMVARDQADATVPDHANLSRRTLAVEAGLYVATGFLALVGAAIVLRIWDAHLHTPFGVPTGDSAVSLMVIKMIVSHGSVFSDPHLGAPHGLELYDFPFFADLGSIVGTWLLGLFSSDPVAVFNAFFFLGFGVCAANAYLVLRVLGLPRGVSVMCGVLYGLLPYHFLRGQGHLHIGAYWAVPLAGLLTLGALGHVRLFARRVTSGPRWASWLTPRTVATIGCALAVGTSLHYYALFTLMLLVLAGVIRMAAERRLRAAIVPVVLIGAVGIGTAAMIAPTLLYRAKHGTDELVAHREPQEAEIYGLKLTSLVLPLSNHRFAPFRRVAHKYASTTAVNAENGSATLGLTMSVALVVAVGALLAAALAGRAPPRDGRLLRDSGLMGLLAFLLGTVGGGSALISYVLTPQLRGWGRISVFIAFFALVALAVLLARVGARLQRVPYGRVAFSAGLVALGVLGVLDQTAPTFKPDYAGSLAVWRTDSRFVRAIDQQLPAEAMVLQLPYVPFPENPPLNRAQDYDELIGYLHSDDLRWSYGAIKGRDPEDWGAAMSDVSMRKLVPAAAAAGFRGIYVDSFAYADGGVRALRDISAAVGTSPTLVSDDRRLAFFSLSPVVQRVGRDATPALSQAAADALLRPVNESWDTGFYNQESDTSNTWHWARQRASLTFDNPAPRPRRLRTSFLLNTPGAPQRVVIQLPGRQAATVTTTSRATAFVRTIVVPPGRSTLRFATTAPDDGTDPRDLHLQVMNPGFVDLGYSELARRVSPSA
jgi:hypothetical protein